MYTRVCVSQLINPALSPNIPAFNKFSGVISIIKKEFSGVANKRRYSLEHHNGLQKRLWCSSRGPPSYITVSSPEKRLNKIHNRNKTSSCIPLNVEPEHLNKALWIKDHCRMETKPLFISSTGIYITSPLQRQCSSRTPKQHSDQQQIAPSSFIVRLAPIKNESNTENYL